MMMFDGRRAREVETLYIIATVESETECCKKFYTCLSINYNSRGSFVCFFANEILIRSHFIRATGFAASGRGTNEKCFASIFNSINSYYKEVKLKLH